MEKILRFVKHNWKYILIAFIALIIGGSFGPSQSEVDASTTENQKMQKELESENEELVLHIETLEADN